MPIFSVLDIVLSEGSEFFIKVARLTVDSTLIFFYKGKEDMPTDLELIDLLTPVLKVPTYYYVIKLYNVFMQ